MQCTVLGDLPDQLSFGYSGRQDDASTVGIANTHNEEVDWKNTVVGVHRLKQES